MSTKREVPTVALQQVTSRFAQTNADRTLNKPVGLGYVTRHLGPDDAAALQDLYPEGKVYIWGSKFERIHQYGKMVPGYCLALFRQCSTIRKGGVVTRWVYNGNLAEHLWGRDADGKTWDLVYFLREVRDLSVRAHEVNQLIGRHSEDHWQGLTIIEPPEAHKVIDHVWRRR